MKMLLCSDVKLGAIPVEKLDGKLSHKWQSVRSEKFEELIDIALQNHANYMVLLGQIFGRVRVTEGLIDRLFQLMNNNATLHVLLFVDIAECERISYRNDIPENLHVISTRHENSYLDDEIAVRIGNEKAEIQLGDNESVIITKGNDGLFDLTATGETYCIPIFEPNGFDEAATTTACGYALLEWTNETLGAFKLQENTSYVYKTVEVKIQANDNQSEILRKINQTVRNIEHNTFLRITLTGQSAFGLTINGDALKQHLQSKIFFVEVYDNTVMEIDEESFDTDISLRSEFVRLAMADETLSESERNRLISCGWNALTGKEVSEE